MLILFTLKDIDTLQHPALYNALIKAPKIGLPAASCVAWLVGPSSVCFNAKHIAQQQTLYMCVQCVLNDGFGGS